MPKSLVRVVHGGGHCQAIETLFELSLRTPNGLVDINGLRKERSMND